MAGFHLTTEANVSSNILRFGEVDGYLFREIKAEEISKIRSKLKQTLKEEERLWKDEANKYQSLLSIPSQDTLAVIKNEIDSIITRSSFLIDPEPAKYLLHIRHEIDYALITHSSKSAWEFFAAPIHNIAINVKRLRLWLKNVADEELTIADSLNR